MNNRETIIETVITLLEENHTDIEDITMREISRKANVGLGLINYHFENKDKLIEICVERIVNGIVAGFHHICEETTDISPLEKLDRLGNMTLTYLFEHPAISRISMLSDMKLPSENDNTQRTIQAFIPLIAACRPDWSEQMTNRMTFYLISSMQQAFLRHEVLLHTQGIDLKNPEQRREFHTQMIQHIIGTQEECKS